MRVALVTEGTYPYRACGVSSWCHQLVTGLRQPVHDVVALTGTRAERRPAYLLPPHLGRVVAAPIWDPQPPAGHPGVGRRARRAATHAAARLCHGMLGDRPEHAALFADGLRGLARLAAAGRDPLAAVPLADLLADAWRGARADDDLDGGTDFRVPLPRLNRREATAAGRALRHALRPLGAPLPPAQLCHATSGGLALLVALAARWRDGSPYLLTEHGIYLRERYLDYGRVVPAAVKAVMLRFFRALSRLGYAEATLVVAASRFNQRWQLRHGAHPAKVIVVPGGVDPTAFPWPLPEPAEPVVVRLGRITPLADLETLIRALRRVRRDVPAARLRLAGPVVDTAYARSCLDLARRLDLADAVELTGPVAHPADAYAAGWVVARCDIAEGTPYPVLEAMMCGRATVAAAAGGVEEVLGDAGLVVPSGDPAALGAALSSLLRDSRRRAELGLAARRRALALFSLDPVLRSYQQLYLDAGAVAR